VLRDSDARRSTNSFLPPLMESDTASVTGVWRSYRLVLPRGALALGSDFLAIRSPGPVSALRRAMIFHLAERTRLLSMTAALLRSVRRRVTWRRAACCGYLVFSGRFRHEDAMVH
jgi:hypothetical protein